MRILLTGGAGFLGLHALRELVGEGHHVTALVRSPSRLGPLARHPGVSVREGDLEDDAAVSAALVGQDVIVHAALIWGPPPTELELRDVVAAARLFEGAGAAGVRRCVVVSSAAVHRPFAPVMSEADPLSATDLYGATKAAGELFLRAACASHGMEGVVLRPGPIVGPRAFPGAAHRTDRRIEAMVAAAQAGEALRVVRGDARQLSDVGRVARAIAAVTVAPRPLPTYLCMEREPTTWEAVARVVLAVTGSTSELRVEGEAAADAPRFRVDRVEALLGGAGDFGEALRAHVREVAAG